MRLFIILLILFCASIANGQNCSDTEMAETYLKSCGSVTNFSEPVKWYTFHGHEGEDLFRVLMPDGYPETNLTEDNVFIVFPNRFGQYSIREIKEALTDTKLK